MRIEIRNDDAGELNEIVAHTDDGALVLHLERMNEGHWWMSIGGVHVNLAAAHPSRTKVLGRWEDEEHVDEVTVTPSDRSR